MHANARKQKRVAQTLGESKEVFRAIFEDASMGIGLTDLEGRILNANPALLDMLGYRAEEFLGRSIVEFIHPEDADRSWNAFHQLRAGEIAVMRLEKRYIRKSGEVLWANLTASVCCDRSQEPQFVIGVIEDITGRKQTERALVESEGRFRLLSEATFEGIVIHDQGRILDANQRYAEMMGYSYSEIVGKNVLDFVSPDHREMISRLIRQGSEGIHEAWGVKKDGTAFLVEVMVRNTVFQGKPVRIGVLRDITRRREAEEEIRRSESEAKRLAHENAVMAEIGRIISSTPDIDEVYERFAEKARELIPFDRIAVNIADLEKNIITHAYISGVAIPGRRRGGFVSLEWTVAREVLLSRQGLLVHADDKNVALAKYPTLSFLFDAGLVSMILIPLISTNNVFGVLHLASKEPNAYTERDLRIAESIGNQIAGAIANAFLFEDRKRTESLLQKERETFLRILENAPLGVVLIDKQGNYVYQNPEFFRITGYSAEEVRCGREWFQKSFPVETSRNQAMDKWKKGRSIGGFSVNDLSIIRKDGKRREIEFRTTFLSDGSAVTMLHDVTEIKKTEAELRSSREWLRAFSAHLQNALENERAEIAREVHDELGQMLTGLKMDLAWLGKKVEKAGKRLVEKVGSMSELVDATIQTVRRISTELRPGILDDLGLIAALEWQAADFQGRTGIRCEFKSNVEDIAVDRDRSTAIFRIVQETLTNVVRHAEATRVEIALKTDSNRMVLRVRDNGRGVSKREINNPKSLGLRGMLERAILFGGELKIKGARGKGTTVTLRMPLRA